MSIQIFFRSIYQITKKIRGLFSVSVEETPSLLLMARQMLKKHTLAQVLIMLQFQTLISPTKQIIAICNRALWPINLVETHSLELTLSILSPTKPEFCSISKSLNIFNYARKIIESGFLILLITTPLVFHRYRFPFVHFHSYRFSRIHTHWNRIFISLGFQIPH